MCIVSFVKKGVGGEEEVALWWLRVIYFPRLTGCCFLQTNLMSLCLLGLDSDQLQKQLPQGDFPFKLSFRSPFMWGPAPWVHSSPHSTITYFFSEVASFESFFSDIFAFSCTPIYVKRHRSRRAASEAESSPGGASSQRPARP